MAFRNQTSRPRPGADLDSPSDFSAPAPKAPLPADPDADTDQDSQAASGTPSVPPDAVHYHDDEQRCELCDNYGQDGQCSLLQMQVQPQGGCNAFTAQQGGDGTTMGMGDNSQALPPAGPQRAMRGGYGS
jgi:hypothetical protein